MSESYVDILKWRLRWELYYLGIINPKAKERVLSLIGEMAKILDARGLYEFLDDSNVYYDASVGEANDEA